MQAKWVQFYIPHKEVIQKAPPRVVSATSPKPRRENSLLNDCLNSGIPLQKQNVWSPRPKLNHSGRNNGDQGGHTKALLQIHIRKTERDALRLRWTTNNGELRPRFDCHFCSGSHSFAHATMGLRASSRRTRALSLPRWRHQRRIKEPWNKQKLGKRQQQEDVSILEVASFKLKKRLQT